jgi:hypothetical protein|tara:strand:- start:172 stop:699 length:528 start_codon:yes stop_codon:yes gene_type:complete
LDIPHEQLDSLALLTPKGVRGWVRNPKRKLPKDVRLSIKLERQLVHLVPRLKKMESKGTGEEKLILYLENLLKKVRKHLRSSALVLETEQWQKVRMPLNQKEKALFDQAFKEAIEARKQQKLRSKEQAKRDAARAAAHREKYGPLAGSSARGRSNCSSGSVRTVQGGAPGLGKRS